MNWLFIICMGIYLVIMVVIGIIDSRRSRDFTEYAVAGRRQSTVTVCMTLLATMLGASATIGITDTVYSIGFPGIWWLIFGAVGLFLQSLLLSERVRNIGADTLPHLAEITVGRAASVLLAALITIAWVGVVAGQLVAMHSLVTFATGSSSKWLMLLLSVIVIAYTALGGQLSVVKTDRVQLLVILVGILLTVIWLFASTPGSVADAAQQVELLNDSYGPMNLFTQFFIIGGVYFLGPDILSRNFLSRDGRAARRSAAIAGIALMVVAFLITMIGLWARGHVTAEDLGGQKTLMYVISLLPKWISVIMSLGLLSAILSSTDTCIINAATIFSRDILGKKSVTCIRLAVLGIGSIATAIALLGSGNIINILSGAYSIYTPGVIFPLLIAILAYGKRSIRKPLWLAAVAAGGCFGLAATFMDEVLVSWGVPESVVSNLSLIGMGVSLVLALMSVRRDRQAHTEKEQNSSHL